MNGELDFCRRCGAEVRWKRVKRADGELGKRIPLELVDDDAEDGRVVIVEGTARVFRDHSGAVAYSTMNETGGAFYRFHDCPERSE